MNKRIIVAVPVFTLKRFKALTSHGDVIHAVRERKARVKARARQHRPNRHKPSLSISFPV